MKSETVRKKFLEFFQARGHAVVPSSSLIPDDPSVLLTTAGMQQFKKYYTGELDPLRDIHPNLGKPLGSKNAVSIQKSFRTSDIDEVGDERHLTFFEMMGNFSFGGYFKEEAIEYAYNFLVKELELKISYVTIFEGGSVAPKDEESRRIWERLGIRDIREQGMADVFWGPTGTSGPCGPTTEVYCKNGREEDIEIWNIVFNEFLCTGSREELEAGTADLKELPFKGIDTGMGLERLMMVLQKTPTVFETDLFKPLIEALPTAWTDERVKRILADHARAIGFLISDGVRPSNKGAGYVLRRLMRRCIVHIHQKQGNTLMGTDTLPMGIDIDLGQLFSSVADLYSLDREVLLSVFREERGKFGDAFKQGLREIKKLTIIDAKTAFKLYESYGLPLELVKELGGDKTENLRQEDFEREFERHRDVSRAGQEKKFGGHGLVLDTGELKAGSEEELRKVTRLHTATHLLHQALRDVLGGSVRQMGSDITVERTRFDFTFPRKLTLEEVAKVESVVNDKIKENLPVSFKEMSKDEAEKTGALHFFKEKYPERVKVYYIGNSLETAYSKEFCGGPHVSRTGEIGSFKIIKEEAVGAGARRVRGGLMSR